MKLYGLLLAAMLAPALTACGVLIDRAATRFAADLERAVIDYDEPLVVERGLPSFLLILEARLQASPEDTELLTTLSSMTGTYAALFVEDRQGVARLTDRALSYARRAACLQGLALCPAFDLPLPDFEQAVARLAADHVRFAYTLGTAWVTWIAARSEDYAALADLPRAELLLERVAALEPNHDDGAVWLYLAVLNSQRPPAAGGRPDLARQQYERAREISRGRNLMIDVFMADQYARLLFDRELFVQRLESVLAADPEQSGYVLANHIAQARARALLKQTDEIFF